MSSKRQEEKNEKIIRGLLKLPPNRRCINCNSLGPQYVCTDFWTFVCMICSGIHREFTHRVKSVSMSKFSSQEVDALKKGGNQRARELFLKTWDPQKQILPDNSNADKVREFIKMVYVEKRHAIDNSSNLPPTDSQNHGGETRRANSYHSYSRSPPYDCQYEERRYGKNVPSLTRKPGSDRGLYEGKYPTFLSPSRLSCANDGSSYPRASDYSVSSRGDQFRSDGLSPSSQRETGSPFSETSSYFSGSDAHKRTESSGSFASFDSMSFKSVNSVCWHEVASEPEQSSDMFHNRSSSSPSLSQSSTPTTFNGLNLFSEPFAPQNVTSLSHQQSVSDVATLNNGGWTTFDAPQNLVPVGTEYNSIPTVVSSSDQKNLGNNNPFSLDQSSNRNLAYHELSSSMHTIWHDVPQKVKTTTHNAPLLNVFEDYPAEQPTEDSPWIINRDSVPHGSDVNNSHGLSLYKVLDNDGNAITPCEIEPPLHNLSSHFSMTMPAFSAVPVVTGGVHSFATQHNKPTNPFDFPCDAVLESSNMTPFWDMGSLQAALSNNHMPALSNNHMPAPYESWFPPTHVASYASGGATFDNPSSFGFMVGQVSSTQSLMTPEGLVASIGGNPFA